MRAALGIAVAASALVACTAGSAGPSPSTSLRIAYWESGPTGERVTWTLRCDPARGSLPQPARACRRLAAAGRRLFAGVAPGSLCTQIYGGPHVARVVGRVAGQRVWATFSREDGCQISRWNALSPWLLPAGGVTR